MTCKTIIYRNKVVVSYFQFLYTHFIKVFFQGILRKKFEIISLLHFFVVLSKLLQNLGTQQFGQHINRQENAIKQIVTKPKV